MNELCCSMCAMERKEEEEEGRIDDVNASCEAMMEGMMRWQKAKINSE